MVSTFSTNKGIESPGHGDQVDSWDSPVNKNWAILDKALGGQTTLNVTGLSGNITLTLAQYQSPYIAIIGTLSADVTYVLPAGVGGLWVIANTSTGTFVLTIASGGGGASTILRANVRTQILSDGVSAVTSTNTGVPSGPNGSVQYSVNGFFTGSSALTTNGAGLTATGPITTTSSITAASISTTGAVSTGALTATTLNVTSNAQVNGTIGLGTAATGEIDLYFRNNYGVVYPYLQSGGVWGVFDSTNPRVRFSTDTAGNMSVSGNLSAANTYAGTTAQGVNIIGLTNSFFSYNSNSSYYATSSGDWDYVFHSSDGWRSQYQKSTGSFLWVNYAGATNFSIDGGGNTSTRGGANVSGNIYTPNTLTAGYVHSTGNIGVDNQMTSNTVYTNYVQSWGAIHASGDMLCNYFHCTGTSQTDGDLNTSGSVNVNGNINLNGSIGVNGNMSTNNSLWVYGTLFLPNAQDGKLYGGGGGLVIGCAGWPYVVTNAGWAWDYGGWLVNSSRESKRDLVPISGALALTLAITGYSFTDVINQDRRMGVVAEEVEAVMPQVVRRIDLEDGHGPRVGVDYGSMVGALFPQVTKELVALITEQSNRIAALEARLHEKGL
jgi:hypothetical protein